jgi:hypothetical protein
MIVTRLSLRCPRCLKISHRPVGFVQAKAAFVCDHCRELARIDKDEATLMLARLEAAPESTAPPAE